MAMVLLFWVVGSTKEADTMQQPQPSSLHILLVPVRPGWPLIHSFRLIMALAPSTLTGWLFKTNNTEVLGSILDCFQNRWSIIALMKSQWGRNITAASGIIIIVGQLAGGLTIVIDYRMCTRGFYTLSNGHQLKRCAFLHLHLRFDLNVTLQQSKCNTMHAWMNDYGGWDLPKPVLQI